LRSIRCLPCNGCDVSHEKYICQAVGFLGTYEKNKDTLEIQHGLKAMKHSLHPKKLEKGKHYLSSTNYTISKKAKDNMFDYLNSIMFLAWYSSNVNRLINSKKKMVHLKFNGYYVLMTYFLLVVLRSILPNNIRKAIINLCAFLNAIS
jgi:hypothetical protein